MPEISEVSKRQRLMNKSKLRVQHSPKHGRFYMEKDRATDEFMMEAIKEAKLGMREGGIPIGSVLIRNGKIIGRGHNKRVQENDPILHAEIDCLRNAGRIGNFKGCVLYSTLMPCYLCAGAVVQFRIEKVFAGEAENFTGARSFMESNAVQVTDLNLDECKVMLKDFIQRRPETWNEDIGEL